MQRQTQQPLRPTALQGGTELQQLLELARAGALNRSAFTSVGGTPGFLPEFSIYSTAQLSGLLGNAGNLQLDQMAQLQQLQNLQNQAALALGTGQQAQPESSGVSRNSQGRAQSRGDKSSSAYASRHQAAEARRRTRINDRLERLRQVVPHSERANTATFLEEVYKYVEVLQARVTELETAQGLPLTCPQGQKQLAAALPQQWLQSVQALAGPAAQGITPIAASSGALPNLATAASQTAIPAAAPAVAPVPAPGQRPDTPPQKQVLEELDEDSATANRETTPVTSSEGSAAKRQRQA